MPCSCRGCPQRVHYTRLCHDFGTSTVKCQERDGKRGGGVTLGCRTVGRCNACLEGSACRRAGDAQQNRGFCGWRRGLRAAAASKRHAFWNVGTMISLLDRLRHDTQNPRRKCQQGGEVEAEAFQETRPCLVSGFFSSVTILRNGLPAMIRSS